MGDEVVARVILKDTTFLGLDNVEDAARQVDELGRGRLHAESQFLLGYGRLNFRIANFLFMFAVHFANSIEHIAADSPGDAIRI